MPTSIRFQGCKRAQWNPWLRLKTPTTPQTLDTPAMVESSSDEWTSPMSMVTLELSWGLISSSSASFTSSSIGSGTLGGDEEESDSPEPAFFPSGLCSSMLGWWIVVLTSPSSPLSACLEGKTLTHLTSSSLSVFNFILKSLKASFEKHLVHLRSYFFFCVYYWFIHCLLVYLVCNYNKNTQFP